VHHGKPIGNTCRVRKSVVSKFDQQARRSTADGRAASNAQSRARKQTEAGKESNKQSSLAYYRTEAGKAARKLAVKTWRETHKDAADAMYACKRAAKINRSVSWAGNSKIAEFYKEACRLSSVTGIPHHVDHIIPLQGALVSGLHVETNLQVLPGVDNIRKRNKFVIGGI